MNFLKVQSDKAFQILILFKKDFFSLLKSPLPCVSLLIFFIGAAFPIIGGNFWLSAGISDFKVFFLNMPLLLSIVIPMLTMSLWADEKKHNTDKLLYVRPVSERAIVCGKYFAVAVIWFLMCSVSLIIPLSLIPIVYFDLSSFFLSYFAMFLFGAAIAAFCTAMSLISKHTALNFFISFAVIVILNLIHIPAKLLNLPFIIKNAFTAISFTLHFESASAGVFDSRDFLFYILLIAAGIELNIFILEIQRRK